MNDTTAGAPPPPDPPSAASHDAGRTDDRDDGERREHREVPREKRHASRRERRRGGVFGPMLLISVGLLLLASNLGYLGSLSLLGLLQFWPLLLVLGGIDLAIGHRAPVLAFVIDVLVVGAAVGLVVAQQPGAVGAGQPPTVGDAALTVPRGTARALELRVTGGAARYTITGGATALVEAVSDRGDLRLIEDRRSGDQATVRLEQSGQPFRLAGGPQNVEVRIASDVALTLRFDAGAGDFLVDLRDLRVREFRSATGAAAIRVILPKPEGDVPIRIESGASSLTIEVPEGVEARVTTAGLVATHTASSRFTVRGKDIESSGYSGARDRVTVTITAGASNVTVR